jgi:hypothetical protein
MSIGTGTMPERAMAEIMKMRKHAGQVTVEEILACRDEGRK